MAKKRIIITEQELIQAVNEEGLGLGHPFESELYLGGSKKDVEKEKSIQLPGSIGVTRTGNDQYWMTYIVDENRRLTKCSTHDTRNEALGMALRRYREFAKKVDFVKALGPSFSYGPLSKNSPMVPTLNKNPDIGLQFGLDYYSTKSRHTDCYIYQMLFYLNLSNVTDESAVVKYLSNGVNAVLMTPLMGYENGKPSDGVDLDLLLRLDCDNNVIAIRFKTGKDMTGDELKPFVRMLYDEVRTRIAGI